MATTELSGVWAGQYILRYPDNYDSNHPYRLVLAYHWSGGSAAQVFDCNQESSKCSTTQSPFFGLWNLSKDSTIFIAMDGLNGGWDNTNGRDFTCREFLVRWPSDYKNDTPYRLHMGLHGYGGNLSENGKDNFGLWSLSKNSTIFVTLAAVGGSWDATADLAYADAVLKQVESELCIDTSRVMLEGFSMGEAVHRISPGATSNHRHGHRRRARGTGLLWIYWRGPR